MALPWQSGATFAVACLLLLLIPSREPALARPPYPSDDPEPTDYGHFEICAFVDGVTSRDLTLAPSD